MNRLRTLPRGAALLSARVRLELLAILFVLVVLIAAVAFTFSLKTDSFHTSGHPIDIKLVGVVPDASDDLYDVEGRKIGTRFYDGENIWPWGSNNLRREFVFELPAGVEIQPVSYTMEAEGGRMFTSGSVGHAVVSPNRRFSINTTTYGIAYRGGRLFHSAGPVEFVDLTLGFFGTNRGKPLIDFKGPFIIGATNSGLLRAQLIFTSERAAQGQTNVQFDFETGFANFNYESIQFFDRFGISHSAQVQRVSTRGGPNGVLTTCGGEVPQLSVSDVVRVTVHEPLKKTFHHVRVRYHDRMDRTYPEANDNVVALLGRKDFKPDQIGNLSFTNPASAWKVIDAVRGSHLVNNAWQALNRTGQLNVATMPAADRDRLHSISWQWANADNATVRFCGGQAGLRGGWVEFIPLAVETIKTAESYRASELVTGLIPCAAKLSGEQITELQAAVLRDRSDFAESLLANAVQCLQSNGTVAASSAVLKLCLDERPWVWWPAIGAAKFSAAATRELPLALRARVSARFGSTDAEVKELLRDSLPMWLTPELERRNGSAFLALLERAARECDRETALKLTVRGLRQLPSGQMWMAPQLVLRLDALAGTEFSKSKGKQTGTTPTPGVDDNRRVIAEVMAWDETRAK